MMRRTLVLSTIVSSLFSATAGADEVEELINTLKPSPLDYAVWAGNLLNAVGDLKDNPGARDRLYEKAYEFGIKQANGYPAAIKAAQALLKAKPDQKAAWQQKLLAVYRLEWQAADRKRKKEAGRAYVEQMIAAADGMAASGGLAEAIKLYTDASRMVRYYAPDLRDAVAQKLKDIRDRQKLQQEVAQCKSVLAASPDNTAIRERLIRLHVVELDQPGEAAKLLTAGVSEQLRTYVPLVVKEVGELPKPVCLELGDWYRSLAAGATRGGKVKALTRAKAYYERFVELEANTIKRTIGKAKLARVEKELRQLGAPALPRGKYVVLDLGNGVKMKLVRIPAGRFLMGSPKTETGCKEHEGPQHWVRISKPFYLGVTEVTQKQYAAVMRTNPSHFKGAERPVEQVSWEETVQFCRKLSEKTKRKARLPTEAEWEYACRAGSKTRFSFGDSDGDLGAYAWYRANSDRQTHEVGKKKPNAWGLYDMHGDVWEWCVDWYGATYYRSSPGADPQGPGSGNSRVQRGGSWGNDPQLCRSANRHSFAPDNRRLSLGFRVVLRAGLD
jgi:formylglycine-generating enzyme required for sulfatase activity